MEIKARKGEEEYQDNCVAQIQIRVNVLKKKMVRTLWKEKPIKTRSPDLWNVNNLFVLSITIVMLLLFIISSTSNLSDYLLGKRINC